MALRCPKCMSEEFYLVVEHTYSFKVKDIGLEDVIPGDKWDSIGGKSLTCDTCDFSGWIEDYHYLKNEVIPLNWENYEEKEEEDSE